MVHGAHARRTPALVAGIAVLMLGSLGFGYALLTNAPTQPDRPAARSAPEPSSAAPTPTVGPTAAEATASSLAETTAFPSTATPPRRRSQATTPAAAEPATGPSLVTVPGHLVTRHVLVPNPAAPPPAP